MQITRAHPTDAAALSAIALAAKRHWGYPENWIQHWRAALTVTPEYIAAHPTFAATVDGRTIGFCALQFQTPESGRAEAFLDHLWVLPAAMGRGAGRALFEHAEQFARTAGATRLKIVGDPHAEGFYTRMGATVYAREPASVDGAERFLPLLEKRL